jgi:hypothetical protein
MFTHGVCSFNVMPNLAHAAGLFGLHEGLRSFFYGRHDTKHNDIQYNDIQHN